MDDRQETHPSGSTPAVAMNDVAIRFGDTVALDDFSLDIDEGEILGLLGPNGSGKTTAVKILATLLRPDRGTACVFGTNVLDDPAEVRAQIALAGQYAAVDELLTGKQNLEMFGRLFGLPKKTVGDRADELLDRFDLSDAADRQAKGYSGGMRRRLDLASSLLTEPRLLFLDEPTTGLDPRSRATIWEVVRDLADSGTTIMLTTQYLEEADALADRIAVMDHGSIITTGTATELKRNAGGLALVIEVDESLDADALAGPFTDNDVEAPATVSATTYRAGIDGDPLRALSGVASSLASTDIDVRSLRLEAPSLDDVFLGLTERQR